VVASCKQVSGECRFLHVSQSVCLSGGAFGRLCARRQRRPSLDPRVFSCGRRNLGVITGGNDAELRAKMAYGMFDTRGKCVAGGGPKGRAPGCLMSNDRATHVAAL
jgi:hypothetical protein